MRRQAILSIDRRDYWTSVEIVDDPTLADIGRLADRGAMEAAEPDGWQVRYVDPSATRADRVLLHIFGPGRQGSDERLLAALTGR